MALMLSVSLQLSAQKDRYFPPYYPTLHGVDEYAAWYATYPDSLLEARMPGEAACTLHIGRTGQVDSVQVVATHPLFARAARQVLHGMTNWQPALLDGTAIDTTVVVHIPFDPAKYEERVWRQKQVLEPCRGQAVDTLPAFPDEVRKLVMGNMRWPDPQVQTAVSVCRFTVNEAGRVVNARVLKGTHPAFDAEALRILAAFPRLIPAVKGGKYMPFDYFLTISFWKLDYEYEQRARENARKQLKDAFHEPYIYPSYPGGIGALAQFVNTHLVVTPEMKEEGKQGRVVYSFEVDIDGTMKNFQLLRSLSPLMDAEALRVLRLVDRRWETGYYFNSEKGYREFYGGVFTIPVIFRW